MVQKARVVVGRNLTNFRGCKPREDQPRRQKGRSPGEALEEPCKAELGSRADGDHGGLGASALATTLSTSPAHFFAAYSLPDAANRHPSR